MAFDGIKYFKHYDLLKDAPIVPKAIFPVVNGTWEGVSCVAGVSQPATNWNYYFANVSSHIGKTLYYGFQTSSTVTGIAFLNLYGKIISFWQGTGNIAGLKEGSVKIPKDAHTFVLNFTTATNTNQDFYAYWVAENSRPEELTLVKKQDLIDIADAIRYKLLQWQDTYKPSEMAPAIDLIDTDVFLSSFIKEEESLYSGTIGTCRWEISKKGVLFLHGGELPFAELGGLWDISNRYFTDSYFNISTKKMVNWNCHYSYWYEYRNYIRMIIIDEPVKAQDTLESLFCGLTSLWLIIGFENIDTSDVVRAVSIFANCSNLISVDLSQNNFLNVENIGWLFRGCTELREVQLPQMSSLRSIERAFSQCSSLVELDLTVITDSSYLQRMKDCFYSCSNLRKVKQNFSNLLELRTMQGVFNGCSKLEELNCSEWETSGLLYLAQHAFNNCSTLKELDLSKLNFSGCTDITSLFGNTINLEEIKTGAGWIFANNLIYTDWLYKCHANIEVEDWDVSNRTSLEELFKNWEGSNFLDLTHWNTSNVITVRNMFLNCVNLEGVDLFSFDMDNVKNMSGMFQNCSSLKWEQLRFFDSFETTSQVTDISYMFNNCVSLTKFELPFSTSSVINFDGFLKGCYKIREINFSHLSLNEKNMGKISALGALENCGSLRTLVIPIGYNTSYFKPDSGKNVYKMLFPVNMYPISAEENLRAEDVFTMNQPIPSNGNTYYGCGSLANGETFNRRVKNFIMDLDDLNDKSTTTSTVDSQVRKIIFSPVDIAIDEDIFNTDFYLAIGAYYNYTGAYATFNSENGELDIFTPNRIIFFDPNSSRMFANFTAVLSIEFKNITTIKATNMSYLFQNCKVLPEIDLSSFNTKNVTDMSFMFTGCSLLEKVDLSPLSLDSCVKINNILEKCHMLEEITFFNQAPLHGFDGHEMFSGCTNLTSFIQPETETSFIFKTLTSAFINCSSLEHLVLPQWNTGALTSCARIFRNCTSLKTIDISTWIFSPGLMLSMEQMFANCSELRKVIFPQTMEPLILDNAKQMFYNCRRLGLDQVGPNGEEDYFKLIPLRFYSEVQQDNRGNWAVTKTKDASYFFAGCECIKTLDLSLLEIEPNHELFPVLDYFLSASQGKYAGYQLEKIIVGDKLGAYLYKNESFSAGQKTTPQSPDVRYQSETTGEVFYSIPINIADTYKVIYNVN